MANLTLAEKEVKENTLELQGLVTNIIIKMQYLEEHLQTALYCKTLLNAFERNKVLTKEEFRQARLASTNLYENLNNKTLGAIIASVKDCALFGTQSGMYDDLLNILQQRNKIVHSFFVESNFLVKQRDIIYLKGRITILSDLYMLIESFLRDLTICAQSLLDQIKKIKGR